MADRQIQRMSRTELLEVLIERTRECEELEKENALLNEKLQKRDMAYEEAGSLAEAALKVSGVFEAAQKAADMYRENAEAVYRQHMEKGAACEADAKRQAERMIIEAERKCREMEQETAKRCEEIRRTAEKEVNGKWDELFASLRKLSEENDNLRRLVEGSGKKRLFN